MSGIVDLHVSTYRPGGRMAEHRHDEAWFCLVVDGAYEESILGMRNEHGPGDLLFCPAGATHGQRFGSEGARKVIFHPYVRRAS
jgi:AraC family transcriptional regulator